VRGCGEKHLYLLNAYYALGKWFLRLETAQVQGLSGKVCNLMGVCVCVCVCVKSHGGFWKLSGTSGPWLETPVFGFPCS
jgi:hypothetical protein